MILTGSDLNHLAQLVEAFLSQRSPEEIERERFRKATKDGLHVTKTMGNLGRLLVTGNSHFDCINWLAASSRMQDATRELVRQGANSDVFLSPIDDSQRLWFGRATGEARVFDESYAATSCDRRGDSEYLLFNGLACELKDTGVDSGVAYLLTERIPCSSCTRVLCDFLRDYPAFSVLVFYIYDSPQRSHQEFFNDVGKNHAGRIDLFFTEIGGETIKILPMDEARPILSLHESILTSATGGEPAHLLARVGVARKGSPMRPRSEDD